MDTAFRKESPPDARKVNDDLKRIGKHAKALAELIGQQPDHAAQIAVHPVFGPDTSILERILWDISTAARGSKLVKPTGRPRLDAERVFAEQAKKTWREAAKSKKRGAYSDIRTSEVRGQAVHIVNALCDAATMYIDDFSRRSIVENLRPRKRRST